MKHSASHESAYPFQVGKPVKFEFAIHNVLYNQPSQSCNSFKFYYLV